MRGNDAGEQAEGGAEGPWARRMREKLVAEFNPSELAIVDESEGHRGHGGYREGGETHFRVHVRSAAFDGKSRVQRQRMVMSLLKPEMDERVHALSLSLSGEAGP